MVTLQQKGLKMQNPYVKQYPDLMVGKKIMYVHGFMSSGQSGTVTVLQTLFPNATVVARDIPLEPTEAVAMLKTMAESEKPDLIIGTSMGGMYTEMLHGYDRILVNPAFEMGHTLQKNGMIGKQVFQNPRLDGVQEVVVTKALVKEYADITTQCFSAVDNDERHRVFGLFGDKDPIVHTFELFHSHYPQAIHFHGEHRLTEKVVHHSLVPIVRWIDDRQEGRTRPMILIDISTMRDSYLHATSSLRKAFDYLVEVYDVRALAPALTNHPEQITEMGAWIEDALSVAAWNRVIYTNDPQLLCADYLISAYDVPEFMGTVIRWGSEQFKTWEEIISYFELLGGQ